MDIVVVCFQFQKSKTTINYSGEQLIFFSKKNFDCLHLKLPSKQLWRKSINLIISRDLDADRHKLRQLKAWRFSFKFKGAWKYSGSHYLLFWMASRLVSLVHLLSSCKVWTSQSTRDDGMTSEWEEGENRTPHIFLITNAVADYCNKFSEEHIRFEVVFFIQ